MSRAVSVYPGAAETEPCPYGDPFSPLPTSWIACAPTGGGKTCAWLSLTEKFYKGMFSRTWVVSPSIKLDPQYKILRDRLDKETDQKKEPLYFEDWDHHAIGKILDDQRAIVEGCRERKVSAPHVLLTLDDMGDYGEILQARKGAKSGGSWMTTLATKGRHFQVSWLITCQKFNQIGRVIRSNARNILWFRQRNQKEVESMCEEMSGWYDKETVRQMYDYATEHQPFSFLFCRLDAKRREDVFWLRFEKRLLPQAVDSKDDGGLHGSGPLGAGSNQPVEEQRPGPPQVRPKGGPVPGGRQGAKDQRGDPVREDPRPGK